jgi:hypothetical protein
LAQITRSRRRSAYRTIWRRPRAAHRISWLELVRRADNRIAKASELVDEGQTDAKRVPLDDRFQNAAIKKNRVAEARRAGDLIKNDNGVGVTCCSVSCIR